MELAIKHAKKAASLNEVPVGVVLIDQKKQEVLTIQHNEMFSQTNPIKHAEILAIDLVCKLKKSRYLCDTTMFVTLEPCAMCATAISEARIQKLYFGAYDEKKGAIESNIRIFSIENYFKPDIYGGIKEKECSLLIKKFFLSKRNHI